MHSIRWTRYWCSLRIQFEFINRIKNRMQYKVRHMAGHSNVTCIFSLVNFEIGVAFENSVDNEISNYWQVSS